MKSYKEIKTKLSDKYKNAFSKEDAKSFDEHTKKLRNEWNNFNYNENAQN